jgi:hypothetical protein
VILWFAQLSKTKECLIFPASHYYTMTRIELHLTTETKQFEKKSLLKGSLFLIKGSAI